jgi:hypothetical protein
MRQVIQGLFLIEFSKNKHKESKLIGIKEVLVQKELHHTLEGTSYIPSKIKYATRIEKNFKGQFVSTLEDISHLYIKYLNFVKTR